MRFSLKEVYYKNEEVETWGKQTSGMVFTCHTLSMLPLDLLLQMVL